MADVENLNKFRKQKFKADAKKKAVENRASFGRSATQRKNEALERDRRRRQLDQARLDNRDKDR